MIADGNPAQVRGFNTVGLRTPRLREDEVKEIKEAYRVLYRSSFNLQQALEQLRIQATLRACRASDRLRRSSQRGIIR